MENKQIEQPKNDSDFNTYFNKSISFNAYTERLLEKVRLAKGHSYISQTIRNLIYEDYHRLKDEGKL